MREHDVSRLLKQLITLPQAPGGRPGPAADDLAARLADAIRDLIAETIDGKTYELSERLVDALRDLIAETIDGMTYELSEVEE